MAPPPAFNHVRHMATTTPHKNASNGARALANAGVGQQRAPGGNNSVARRRTSERQAGGGAVAGNKNAVVGKAEGSR